MAEVLALEEECVALREEANEAQKRVGLVGGVARSLMIQILLGRRLPRELGVLWSSMQKGADPLLGPELSAVLDAATRRILGYKRWILLFALLAATPAILSMFLLWQQSNAVAREKDAALADSRLVDRSRQLATIYLTQSGEEVESLTTPLSSMASRRAAVFRLIELDSLDLQSSTSAIDEEELQKAVRMVDLSIAPLAHVDFSPFPGDPSAAFVQVSFVNANLEGANFSRRELTDVWFDNANLRGSQFVDSVCLRVDFRKADLAGADFTGATLADCLFEGAKVDATTIWPEGFSPPAMESQPTEETP
ncbi:MAG: pentapeptide repeat-containing protein [Verrucomicrobiota bacterium]